MADDDNAQNSRKRGAANQINKDNPEPDDDSQEQELGTFRKASEEVMATRRIVKVRRHQQPAAPAAASNPFAAIRLVPPVDSGIKSSGTENADKDNGIESTSFPKENADTGNNIVNDETNDEAESKNGLSEVADNIIRPAESSASVESKGDDNVKEGEHHVGEDIEDGSAKAVVDEKDSKDVVSKEEDTDLKVTGDVQEEDSSRKEDPGAVADEENKDDKDKQTRSLSSFEQLSTSKNAFSGLAPGCGMSGGLTGSPFSSGFSFGTGPFSADPASKDGLAFTSGSLFGLKGDNSSFAGFNFGSAKNGCASSALTESADASKEAKVALQEVPVETGEENERAVFAADAMLYEYADGGWKERGKGEVKLNVSAADSSKARLVMRTKGNLRLILNAGLFADMSLKDMDKRGITFACVNIAMEDHSGLATFALKFKDSTVRAAFVDAVNVHKGKKEAGDVSQAPEDPATASEV